MPADPGQSPGGDNYLAPMAMATPPMRLPTLTLSWPCSPILCSPDRQPVTKKGIATHPVAHI
jgi:hypothetical protein